MKYYRIILGNGRCGCDEEYLGVCKNDETVVTLEELIDGYTYLDGYAGIENEIEDGTEEEFWEEYYDDICNNSEYFEISEEMFNEYKDDGIEVWEL